jgi:hypothetical protein
LSCSREETVTIGGVLGEPKRDNLIKMECAGLKI